METPRQRLLELLRVRSFKKGDFLLASGKRSDFFIDCKRTILCGEGHVLAGEALLRLIEDSTEAKKGLEAIAAVPLGGVPLADSVVHGAFSRGLSLDLLYVRPEAKDHGTGQRIEGAKNLKSGARVILLEDVVTTGGSSLRAVTALREAGFTLLSLIALVDRLEGGRETLEAEGVPFCSLFSRRDFIPDESTPNFS